MPTDPSPYGATEDALAPTLARPDGPPAAPPGSIESAFGAPAHAGELGTFGTYRVLKKLGQGGMGAVYLAHDAALERKVALKVMLPQFAAEADARERFVREARSAAKVKSDHVVVVYEVREERGVPFIAMEYLLGAPLDAYLKQKGELPLAHALRVGREVALGLAAVHELGLVHRDVKPGNVWLEAPKGRAKLLDFGLARAERDVNLTGTGAVVGTVAYMSPEQGRGEKVDHRSDLFSLGTVLFRLCTGQMPFKGTSAMALLTSLAVDAPPAPRALNPQLPAALEPVLLKLLAKNPDDRYQSAREVADALLAVGRAAASVGPAPVVVVPLAVGAQTQNVWDGIDDSASVAVPLDSSEVIAATIASARPDAKARRAPSKWPVFAAVAGLVVACAVLAAVLLWPKKEPEGARPEPDKPGDPKTAPKPVADTDRKVAEWALAKGGAVTVAAKGARFDPRNREALPTGAFVVERINLAGIKTLTDGDLKPLAALRALAALDLRGANVTAAQVADLRAALPVCQIEWDGTKFDDRAAMNAALALGGKVEHAIDAVKGTLRVTGLFAESAPWTDDTLSRFAGCKTLRWANLCGTKVTDACLVHLTDSKGMSGLLLADTKVADAGLVSLKEIAGLQTLQLDGTIVTDAGLDALKECKALTALGLHRTQVTPAKVAELQKALPMCKISWDAPAKK